MQQLVGSSPSCVKLSRFSSSAAAEEQTGSAAGFHVYNHTFCLSRENYLFACACVKCESQRDELDVTSEDEEEEEGGEAEGETEGDEMEEEMTDV